MARNRMFFPQQTLDDWVSEGIAELRGQDLILKNEGKTYRLAEGVRILREVTGEPDTLELVGRCKTRAFLKEMGADVVEASMVLDNNAYDVVPGFLGTLSGSSSSIPVAARLNTDEELLAEFLAKKM